MGALHEDLTRRDAFLEEPGAVEVVETHISWVFLTEAEAFKVKKPVDFGFLDFRDLGARRRACEEEVRVNERLTRGVYRGLVPVRRTPDGRHVFGEAAEGEIVDWAVRMRRLSDAYRADRMLAEGRLRAEHLDRLAERLARFHADQEPLQRPPLGTHASIAHDVEENFGQVGDRLTRYVTPHEADELRAVPRRILDAREQAFARRLAQGRIREGHGDLRLEHVYFEDDGPPQVLDGIEFNERFRCIDVCSDVAFLSMDLAHAGAVDLAERFLAVYARASNDYDLYGVVDFYEAYRAFVRGKIEHFVASDAAIPEAARRAAVARARSYFLLALSAERTSLLAPQVVCVGGIIAAGKSTVAEALASEMSAPLVSADHTRKGMIGVEATKHVHDGAWSGAYTPAFTEAVYEEVLRRARVVLASGRPIVIDASFRSRQMRAAAMALAKDAGVPFRFLECRAPLPIVRARLAERAKGQSVSDGRLEVLDDFVKRFEPVTELSSIEHVVVDTTHGLEDELDHVRARVITWPRGMTA